MNQISGIDLFPSGSVMEIEMLIVANIQAAKGA